MFEWVQWLIGLVLPEQRWKRQLERDLTIYRGLPKGPQRKAYRRHVVRLTDRINEYRDEFPTVEKAFGWLALVSGSLMVVNWAMDGPEETVRSLAYTYGPAWPILGVTALLIYFWAGFNTLRGRVINGMTPREHQQRLEAEGRLMLAARRKHLIRKRAKAAFRR